VPATLCRRLFLKVGLACLGGLAFYAAGACFIRPRPPFLMNLPGSSPRLAAEVTAADMARLGGKWLDATEEAAWRTLLAA
jgi:hypothetical protein